MEKIFKDKSGKNRPHVLLQCKTCKNDFWKVKRFVTENNYCSKDCSAIGNRDRETLECKCCKKSFESSVGRGKNSKSGFRFCSRKCKDEAQKVSYGLKEMWPDHFGMADGKRDYRERAIEKYGRKCELCEWDKTIEVHHIDGNRENNDLKNLIVLCPNCHSLTKSYKHNISEEIVLEIEQRIKNKRGIGETGITLDLQSKI